jgi:uncharacterized protein (TIGR00369 family)
MKNLDNIKFVLNKLRTSSLSNYGKNINSNLILIEDNAEISRKLQTFNFNSDVVFKFKILKDMCNIQCTMHGGAISTLVDIATTVAISGMDRDQRHNVSVELSTHFLNPIKIDSQILVHCKIPKIGKSLAYSYADIYDEEDMKLSASATHIKAMINKTWRE